ncbi:MAG: hypothetical protein M1831_007435 [Alyxoria varia]|nr:MAG: hypothetical protein M1831_007435 [Alyxoria varia]
MPPKKKTEISTKQEGATSKHADTPVQQANGADKKEDKPMSGKATNSAKRKNEPSKEEPQKAPRRSGRGAGKPELPPAKIFNFLLSSAATDLCRPKDEQDKPKSLRTYTSTVPLSPFEELLSAVVLSRPISHALGQRSIRTILNPPYDFRTPKAIIDAGSEKRHQALWDAKTQHKQKTVDQMTALAELIREKFSQDPEDVSLEKLRKESEYDADIMREVLTTSIKGVGATAVNIFMRRVQAHFKECYPYVDERTKNSMEKLGLPTDGDALQQLIAQHWKELNLKDISASGDDEKKRIVFVRILERAIQSDLEGKTDDVIAEASK